MSCILSQSAGCVSTHSRPKAAGSTKNTGTPSLLCFNTQPPEGGWARSIVARSSDFGFNTQPPEGGWAWEKLDKHKLDMVSTHSRPKAAGPASAYSPNRHCGFQHTAARRRLVYVPSAFLRSLTFQHTAARRRLGGYGFRLTTFYGFNTQPPEGGWQYASNQSDCEDVSTHSRPKAAGKC